MARGEDDQWSWWEHPTGPPASGPAQFDPLTAHSPPTSSDAAPPLATEDDRLRKGLIVLVAVLTVSLAVASYARFGPDGTAQNLASAGDDAAVTTAAPDPTTLPSTTLNVDPTSAPAATVLSTTTTSTTVPSSQATSSAPLNSASPSEPSNVVVVSTGPTSAEIRWESAECVGSLYQVGDFEPGSGGYPDVDRCWFNHVVLAGDDSFSPALTPNTDYVVRIQAVNQAGATSAPVEISFRTTPG